jgi:hypothetical protein
MERKMSDKFVPPMDQPLTDVEYRGAILSIMRRLEAELAKTREAAEKHAALMEWLVKNVAVKY